MQKWSGKWDSNSRSPAPKAGALSQTKLHPEILPLKNNITPYGMGRISEWSSILLISHCPRFYQKSKMALFFMSLCVHRRYPLMLFFNGAPSETRTRTRRLASKTSVSTNSTTGAFVYYVVVLNCCQHFFY